MARADGSLSKLFYRLARVDVLVVDDCAMAPLVDAERRDFLEICDERYQTRSTILTSQLPVGPGMPRSANPGRRQHPGPARAQCLSDRAGRRIHAQRPSDQGAS